MVCNFNTNCTTDECSDDVTDINTCDCNDKNIILTESGLLPKNFTDFYICSTHFNQLLKRNSDLRRRKVCQLPTLICAHPPVASHSVVGVKKPKPSRNITITDVEKIQKCYGLTLPIGTPACTSCLIKISKQSTEIEAESLDQGKCEDDQIQQCTKLNTDDETYLMETDQLDVLTEKENICDNLIEISASEYTVTSEESGSQNYLSQSQQSVRSYERCSYLTSLNDFLSSVRLQEFSEKERKTWRSYTFKTRNTYKERFDEIMKLIIEILFPNDVDEVIDDIKCPKQLNEENRTSHTEYKDIVTSYRKAESWQQGRQVLSVLASRMSFKDLLSLLPEVTSHRYYAALSHSKKIGPALPIPEKKLHRQKLDPERLDAFLDFITSSHVVRDLPFGEKKLKFSDGTVHNLPNVVRCMGSADIIQQYKAYSQENEISLLGDSTMFKILAQCGAKVRKSLEGLDYFVAEGGRAFITFQDVLDKLLTYDAISPDDHKSFQALFLQSKQYLRTDYKIHISKGREVADHCMLYALSDEKDEAFTEQCSHNHQMVCESCEQLKETIAALQKIFVTSSVDGKEDEMNDLNFRVQQATKSIFSLKKHIIRCKNQDLAKTQLFETMPSDEVLLVCDWAMKFLPRKFREDQCDWFGKRGIPWHISIAFCRKDDGSIGSLGFVHLFATQISQDSQVTASII
ncbi:uncharacterized protein LOC143080426 [Mytilus galloprovincialis]|uniref:uncharacterized protein LOC143080426 n=1 Tax=Mytilus galloprovincialis TaxID=29158 RepID=UPI003F7B616D